MPSPPAVATPAIPLHEQPEIHAKRWFLLGIMCLSLVLVVMSVSGLNTALPSIQRDLGATASELQWIVDAYAVVFAGLLLSAGAVGDRFGRRLDGLSNPPGEDDARSDRDDLRHELVDDGNQPRLGLTDSRGHRG